MDKEALSRNKMKVLMINNRPPNCGIGEYTYSLYHAMRQTAGENVELVSWESAFIEKLYRKVRENYILQYPEEGLRILSQIYFLLTLPKSAQVYHLTNSSLSIAALRLKPCVVTVHDLIPFNAPRDMTDRLIQQSVRFIKHAQRIICVSLKTRDDLLHYLDVDRSRVRVIYEGIDSDRFKPRDKAQCRKALGLPPDKPIILHVGSEEPRKNLPILIKAFHRLQQAMPEAILVRVGEKTEATVQVIDSLGLGDKVSYFQNVTELEQFYNAADLLAFPSLEEGFGFPPLQAMASGCPVVASNTTSIPEVVGDAGILLDPADIEGFANRMQEILTRSDLNASLTARGLERSRIFYWDKFAAETMDVYQEIAV